MTTQDKAPLSFEDALIQLVKNWAEYVNAPSKGDGYSFVLNASKSMVERAHNAAIASAVEAETRRCACIADEYYTGLSDNPADTIRNLILEPLIMKLASQSNTKLEDKNDRG